MKKSLVITERFAAAHLYHQKKWGKKQNQEKFGKCFSEHGHGHNYRLEVAFAENAGTLEDLQESVRLVASLLDHKHLNFDVADFKESIPTTENIASFCMEKLKFTVPTGALRWIKLYELDDLWVEIKA